MYSMLASRIFSVKVEFPNRSAFVKLGKVNLDLCDQFS